MQILIKAALVLAAATVCWSSAGCQTESTHSRPSGFLKDTDKLKPRADSPQTLQWWSADADLGRYQKVLMLPVEIWLASDAEYKGVRPSELDQLADAFSIEVARELTDGYRMTDAPGPGVLVVRAALTDVRPANPTGNWITSIPGVRLVDRAAEGVAGTHLYVGEVVMEAELLDGATGERIMAIVDRKTGEKRLSESSSRWGDVHAAFRDWGRALRLKLDEARPAN